MANSYISYTGNGVLQNYSLSFPYLDVEHITATVAGVDAPFTWVNTTTLNITAIPALGAAIILRRTTPSVVPVVDFTNGSIVTEDQLDSNAKQSLYIAQEAQDNASDSMGLNDDGQWDGLSKRITSVADPVAAQDVATKTWVETVAASGLVGPTGPATWAVSVPWQVGLVCTLGPPTTTCVFAGQLYVCIQAHTAIPADPNFNLKWALVGATGAAGTNGTNGTNGVDATAAVGDIKAIGGRVAASGWLLCNGSAVSRATYPTLFTTLCFIGTATMTIAAPGVVTRTAHGLSEGDPVKFTTSGALPTGVVAGTTYYVKYLTANTYQLAATPGGTAITTTGSQSGTHTSISAPDGDGDGSTTFNVPNLRGLNLVGHDLMGSAAASRITFAVSGNYGNSLGKVIGEQAHALTGPETGPHTHSQVTGTAGSYVYMDAAALPGASPIVDSISQVGGTTGSGGTGTAHNVVQPGRVTYFVIRT